MWETLKQMNVLIETVDSPKASPIKTLIHCYS